MILIEVLNLKTEFWIRELITLAWTLDNTVIAYQFYFLYFSLIEMRELGCDNLLDIVALWRPKHLGYIGELDRAVRADIGWE